MRPIKLVAALALSLALSGGVASAATINGGLSIAGGLVSFTNSSISFAATNAITGTSGSLNGLGTCAACVTFPTNPYTTASPPAVIFHAVNNGLTLDVLLNTAVFTPGNGGASLTITGTGIMSLTGFNNTPLSSFILTANTAGGTFSMSASAASVASVVPLPGALPLFAGGLVGLWALGRRRRMRAAA